MQNKKQDNHVLAGEVLQVKANYRSEEERKLAEYMFKGYRLNEAVKQLLLTTPEDSIFFRIYAHSRFREGLLYADAYKNKWRRKPRRNLVALGLVKNKKTKEDLNV